MKKINLFLLLIILLMPIIVTAHDKKDLEFKWKAEIGFDNFYEKDSNGNLSNVNSNDLLYMIQSYDNITWIDKLTGDTFKYRIQNYKIEEINNEKYVLGQRDSDTHILKLDNNLEIEKKLVLKEQQSHSLIIKDEKIITITYKTTDNKIYEYLINIYDQELNLLENHSTIMPTYIYSCGDKNFSFNDNYGKYYYLNEEYKIVPYVVKENGDYTIFDGKSLKNVQKNGNIIKEYLIASTNIYSSYYRETDNKKYVLINKKEYISSTDNYNSEVTLYILDDNLNLLTQKVLGTETNYYYYEGITSRLYLNEDEIITRIDEKYYKIDDLYNAIETLSSEAKDTFELTYEEYENDNYYDDEYYDNKREIEEELEKYAKENFSNNVREMVYDFTKYDNNYYVSVTWIYNCKYEENIYYCNIKNDLVKIDKNYNIKKVENISPEIKIKPSSYNHGYNSINTTINKLDEVMIVATGGELGNILKTYDTNLNVVKDYSDVVSESTYSPIGIIINKNSFLLINQFYDPPPTPANITTDKMIKDSEMGYIQNNNSAELYYFEFPYEITTEVTGKGTIEVNEEKHRAGEHIKFIVTPEKGYVLSEVKVTDSEGNVLIFTDYEFTMPTADVLIEAKFIPEILENPATRDSILIFSILILGSVFFIKHFKSKKESLI